MCVVERRAHSENFSRVVFFDDASRSFRTSIGALGQFRTEEVVALFSTLLSFFS
jgi:hypothetical protein